MAISDLILRARVNMAIARDPRVSALELSVFVDNCIVTLRGDVDSADKCNAAEEAARSVEGVTEVRNEMTCGLTRTAATATEVVERLLRKLDDEWTCLPEHTALTQADYLRWALWLLYKFHIPAEMEDENWQALTAAAVERGLQQVAGYLKASVALLALEMIRQAEMISDSPWRAAPATATPRLHVSPVTDPTTADKTPCSSITDRQHVTRTT